MPLYLTRDSLDLQHALSLLTFDNKLYVSPMDKQPHRVLDVGCGTGLWAVEFGALPFPFPHPTGQGMCGPMLTTNQRTNTRNPM